MEIHILSIFPEMFASVLDESILGRAQSRGLIQVYTHNIRDFTEDRHRVTDDIPYGGGPGMVMKPEPIVAGIQAIRERFGAPYVILLSPQGQVLDQEGVKRFAHMERLLLICGRYSGVDARVTHYIDAELSIGDYVLTGGEIPAMVLVDAVARMIPQVLGDAQSAEDDSLFDGLLQGPVYTRPVEFETWCVPDVLRSGNHAAVAKWRRRQALWTTWQRRPDLLQVASLSAEDRALVQEFERGQGS
ncbi:MAG: tRNA (guanine-N1)-methyltransferase [Candidatus Entotheonella factor]|uniref:tRNA (guanine-N(1)-)-methyltransferase n=1 Tax=Entotheonella factor TaxID=1429438 RepID=W4LD40_ENTF1|nr:tRNA (guanosine(37)-N1)-methyltransferase TrmD [Candidatus Entotheonella palauensis]ETW96003.1 MAG: tRNA (guanine-N1)-methyltransferase [Candidatus Entotheonella factor]